MNIPKYVIDMMNRSRFAVGYGDPGYTIEIQKSTPYTKIPTLEGEVSRLIDWCERQMPHDDFSIPVARIDDMPHQTHYVAQHAVVTIYDSCRESILRKAYEIETMIDQMPQIKEYINQMADKLESYLHSLPDDVRSVYGIPYTVRLS